MLHDISDVSVIICTKNNVKNIEYVINSVLKQSPGEIIVVDGSSTDGTREVLEKLPVKLLSDPGKGLALARQIGLDEAKKKYVFYSGDDNIYRKNEIYDLKVYMNNHDYKCVGMLNRVYDASKDYWSKCADIRWKARFSEGERPVVGTPNMYEASTIKSMKWNTRRRFSDDTDLQERIKKIGGRIAYSNIQCYEIGQTGYEETIARFTMYGVSDYEVWINKKDLWSLRRKVKSLLHPMRDELICPLISSIKTIEKIYALPYFVLVTILRYKSWIINIKDNKK